jgi:hypothetical protein
MNHATDSNVPPNPEKMIEREKRREKGKEKPFRKEIQ